MHRHFLIRFLIPFIILLTLACGIPAGLIEPPPVATLSQPEIAGTVAAAIAATRTQSALVAPPTATKSSTPTPTMTRTPTITVTPSPTLTPTNTLTPTPEIPIISVSVNTNCRDGPGKVYDYLGALLVTQTAEVFAKDPSGEYWYIRNPNNTEGYCWVWGQYASINGNTNPLPVYTPPPTPTPPPSFSLNYYGLDSCVGWFPDFQVINTGNRTFQSAHVTVKDKDTSISIGYTFNGFDKVNGCVTELLIPTIDPDETGYVHGYSFSYDPSGHEMTATVKLCTDLNLGGVCASKSITFTP
jgi:hypothetical protein